LFATRLQKLDFLSLPEPSAFSLAMGQQLVRQHAALLGTGTGTQVNSSVRVATFLLPRQESLQVIQPQDLHLSLSGQPLLSQLPSLKVPQLLLLQQQLLLLQLLLPLQPPWVLLTSRVPLIWEGGTIMPKGLSSVPSLTVQQSSSAATEAQGTINLKVWVASTTKEV